MGDSVVVVVVAVVVTAGWLAQLAKMRVTTASARKQSELSFCMARPLATGVPTRLFPGSDNLRVVLLFRNRDRTVPFSGTLQARAWKMTAPNQLDYEIITALAFTCSPCCTSDMLRTFWGETWSGALALLRHPAYFFSGIARLAFSRRLAGLD